jgi:UDP-N-acetylglucosamine--N-acetylmuramyl-(pentapeptide) pyrophosphoryl-undecaprenol N-acetylglucosamine transferase
MTDLRVIIAGGGTGGHIFPAIAIGQALQRLRPGTQLLFVGAKGKMEMDKVPAAGYEIVGLDITGFNRSNMLKNLLLPVKLLRSRIAARNIIATFKPDAVVGVGGYASFPMLSAAQAQSIPTLIQEQNAYAGKSNKILGKRAKAVCVAYKGMERFFRQDSIVLTGNPVRKNISDMSRTAIEGRVKFGMKDGLTTVLVVGGSLGARSINEAIAAQLGTIVSEGVQIIWQTGKPYFEEATRVAAMYNDRVMVHEFIADMEYAYAAADIVISRAGALAIAELCIAAKPVIFVPYPLAAENHQEQNAMSLVSHNAALMVRDSDVHTELIKKLKLLMKDTTMQQLMSQNLQLLAVKDADERIAMKVIEIAGKL